MVVKVAGGANILDDTNYFRIGQKNLMAMRKIFWRNNVLIDGEETGENFNRTVRLELSNGRCILKSSNGTVRDL
jgi:chemotaxis protein CheD